MATLRNCSKERKATDFINKLKEGVDFAELYLKVLAGLIRFVDRGADKNKARWKTSEFWNNFIKNSEGVKLKSKNLDPSLDKTIKWIDESVLTSLQLLVEVAKKGDLDLLEILKNSKIREKSDRQKSMLNEFDLLSEDQKQEIFNKIKDLAV